jgi:hypothetical protein
LKFRAQFVDADRARSPVGSPQQQVVPADHSLMVDDVVDEFLRASPVALKKGFEC